MNNKPIGLLQNDTQSKYWKQDSSGNWIHDLFKFSKDTNLNYLVAFEFCSCNACSMVREGK